MTTEPIPTEPTTATALEPTLPTTDEELDDWDLDVRLLAEAQEAEREQRAAEIAAEIAAAEEIVRQAVEAEQQARAALAAARANQSADLGPERQAVRDFMRAGRTRQVAQAARNLASARRA